MKLLTTSLLLLLNAGESLQFEIPATLALGRTPALVAKSAGYKLLSRQDSCDGQVCADVCIPSDAMCCDVTVGIYCEAGTTCTTSDTCIDDSSRSGGGSSLPDCGSGQSICGGGCISSDNNCCSDITGDYCENGMECLSASSCDDTTGNGSGGDASSASASATGSAAESASESASASASSSDASDDSSSSGSFSSATSTLSESSTATGDSTSKDDKADAASTVSMSMALVILSAVLALI